MWICQLIEHGLVRPSFVPPQPIRELRDLTRYRQSQIEEPPARCSGWTRSFRMPGSSSPASRQGFCQDLGHDSASCREPLVGLVFPEYVVPHIARPAQVGGR